MPMQQVNYGQAKPAGADKKIAAGLCGILLGSFGVHKFILGYQGGRFREYLDLIAAALVEGQITGEFEPAIHPTVFKQVVFGAVDQIATAYTISRSKGMRLSNHAEEITAVLLDGIRKK